MQPGLSVIVPVYNVRPYLVRCLDSILAQTYRALDIVLVDDGSTDGSGELCDRYAAQDVRIRVVHQQNGGAVRARKAGLLAANSQAPFVTFVDSDDWLESDAYTQMMEIVVREHVQCVLAGHYENTGSQQRACFSNFSEGRYDRVRMEREFFPQMMGKDPFFTWGIFPSLCNKIFAKELMAPIMLAEDEHIRMGEDAAVVFLALCQAEAMYVYARCFYHYVQKIQSNVKTIPPRVKERQEYDALNEFVVQYLPAKLRGGVDNLYALYDGAARRCFVRWLGTVAVSVPVYTGQKGLADYSLWCRYLWSATLSGVAKNQLCAGHWLERSQCSGAARNRSASSSSRGYRGYASRGCSDSYQYRRCQIGRSTGTATALSQQTHSCVEYRFDFFPSYAQSFSTFVNHAVLRYAVIDRCTKGSVTV